MQVVVESEVFEKFPGFLVGLLEIKGLSNQEESYRVHELLADVSLALKTTMTPEQLSTHDLLSAYEASKAMHWKHYKSGLELLLRRVLRGEQVRHVNKLVDISRYASLKHLVPISVIDLSFLQDLHYTLAKSKEEVDGTFMGKPTQGALVLKDRIGVIANWFGHRQSEKTLVTPRSSNVLLRVEVLNPPVPEIRLEFILNDLADMIKTFCGGVVNQAVLSKENAQAEF